MLFLAIPLIASSVVLSSCSRNKISTSVKESVSGKDIGLTLSETEITLALNATKQITATTEDDSIYLITWQSADRNIATVKSGLVTAVSVGETTITASARKKGSTRVLQTKELRVIVKDATLTLDKTEATISLSETNKLQLVATVKGSSETLTWSSSDPSVATVDDHGLVTGLKAGDTIITVTNGELSATCKVSVRTNYFSLAKTSIVAIGKETTLEVTGTPSADAVWESEDASIASVVDGKVKGLKVGMTRIHLKSSGDNVDAVSVVMVKSGEEKTSLLPMGMKADAAGNPMTWYALKENEETVTTEGEPLMDNGMLRFHITHVGKENGELSGNNFFYLRYQPDDEGNIKYKEKIYLYSESAARIAFNGGEDKNLNPGFNLVEEDFTSVDPVTRDAVSQMKFKCTGDFYLIPVFEKVSEIKHVKLSEKRKKIDLSKEDAREFTLTASLSDNSPVSSVDWVSSDEGVAKVENGKVTILAPGVTKITATVDGYASSSCKVTVVNSSNITLDHSKVVLDLAKKNTSTITLQAFLPEGVEEGKTITWTSDDESVATVSDGKIIAHKVGTCNITASIDSYQAVCAVTVKDTREQVLSLSESAKELDLNGNKQFTLTYTLPSGLDGSAVVWTSSDEKVCSVDNGKVTALSVGKTTITAAIQNYRGSCEVTVVDSSTKTLSLSSTSKELDLAGEKEFDLTFERPEGVDGTATYSSSAEDVCSVDQTGKVTALKEGTSVITVTLSNYQGTCQVTVINSQKEEVFYDVTTGKNDAVLANRNTWYSYTDSNTKLGETKATSDNHVICNVLKNKTSKGTDIFSYLRFAPSNGSYVADYTILYTGEEECSVIVSGPGNEKKDTVLVEAASLKSGNYSFTIDNASKNPFQFKFKAIGTYDIHVTFRKA